MKILEVISHFPPAYSYGGPVKVVYDISEELVKRGHQVSVYTTDVFDARSRLRLEKNPILMDGIEVYHFRNISNVLAHDANLPIAFGIANAIKKNIKNFDIVHLHEYRSFQAICVHYYATRYSIPYILQPRGSLPRFSKTLQKEIFDDVFGINIVKDANKIIATSNIESDQYIDIYPDVKKEKILHIPNGINLKEYQILPKKGQFKNKYAINRDTQIVLFLSRLHERKGADLLIESFSDLKRDLKNVKLVIAGPDEGYLDTLKSITNSLELNDSVIFPGPLYGISKLEAYIDSDVFILPSKDRYESFGNVVLEAMACGTPVIVTNNCGVSEFIDSSAGLIINYNKKELYNAMCTILTDRENKERRYNYLQNYIKNFSLKANVDMIESAYHTILIDNCK